ncbi:hypothetical protein I3843_13G024700 [Carya illinoinensis]|uniref:RanBP2-type domain-containing protein n=1 Tax=Carya illinoinensis TaxID=32201 RepID=A0A8T1NP55_CARIL|nr:hypothetical protein CIPAW_13G027200 [Carya illinoinensis]KAG7948754.1 hypothetical protein I3843_13G024700 [Carya illinoinensis]
MVPSANAIFFNGDRIEGTGNSVIERLSDLKTIAGLLVSKFGTSVNAWVFESSIFNGPFAVYKDFIPSVNRWGEPKSYSPLGFPASRSTISLLSNCLNEVKNVISRIEGEQQPTNVPALHFSQPKTLILGFSKGGTVINQLVTELSCSDVMLTGNTSYTEEQSRGGQCSNFSEAIKIIPDTEETLLNSITEVHYVDVGLNSSGAYLTDHAVIERIYKRLSQGAKGIRFLLHGTPRQWCDSRRNWVRTEKDNLVHMLESAARRSGGKLQVDNNRGPFGSKRSRNDASRSEGDWTCPKCGNVNFGFRVVCNREKCSAPRPPVTPPAPFSPYNTPFYFGGVGAPPLPYGLSGRYGSPIPHSGMRYDYGVPASAHGPYGPMPTFPPGAYGGMGYGSGPAANGYGFGFQGPPWAGVLPDNPASRKRRGGPDGLHEGDWICPKCENVNFAFRTNCNIKKCGAPRPSLGPNQPNTGGPEGSWTCDKCGNLNYPFRTVCNRKDCGNEKPDSGN